MSEEPPNKKIRLEVTNGFSKQAENIDKDTAKEIRCGITTFVNPHIAGFSGVLKQRFTDFLVNEITPSGEVVHLTEIAGTGGHQTTGPQKKGDKTVSESVKENKAEVKSHESIEKEEKPIGEEDQRDGAISTENRAELVSIFGEKTTASIEGLYKAILKHPERKRRDFTDVLSDPIEEKENRTKAHQTIRKIFSSQLETTTGENNSISISKGGEPNRAPERRNAGKGRTKGRLGWEELGGEYLHFSLYKENKDTMEIINYLATQMKQHTRNFQFAGTKDRRAVTVQRVSAYRVQSERLAGLGRNLRGGKVGNFSYQKTPLTLGELQGNEFVITLRDCHFHGEEDTSLADRLSLAKSVLSSAGQAFLANGFINYFGLQRFGSFAVSTDEVGKALLQGELGTAVKLILTYKPEVLAAAQGTEQSTTIASDDRNRALAIHIWDSTQDSRKALDLMPRKFGAEISIIRHLGMVRAGQRVQENDFQGALSNIQRSLRTMYVHAYQSLVWNTVAGERWKRFGSQVMEGDLIITHKPVQQENKQNDVDDAGELVINPETEGRAADEDQFTRARPLTKVEAESGAFSIWDIVLPLPGYDVEYPANEIGRFYTDFMGSDRGGGLDPTNMRRKWRDISLSGGYRKLLARPASFAWELKTYMTETEQLVETDIDRLVKTNPSLQHLKRANEQAIPTPGSSEKVAVILSMQLGSSQYATIALRELMKEDGLKSYIASFNTER